MQAHLILAFGAGACDKSVCQELAGGLAVQLLNGLLHKLPCPVQCVENALGIDTHPLHTHTHISMTTPVIAALTNTEEYFGLFHQ